MGQGIFISYRRVDSLSCAERLDHFLRQRFPTRNVFFDFEKLQTADDWKNRINEEVRLSRTMLALIGDDWGHKPDADGRRRLHEAEDIVRFEIETALRYGVNIVPVLVGEAELPRDDDVPSTMRGYARRHATRLREIDAFEADAQELSMAIGRVERSAHELDSGAFRGMVDEARSAYRHREPPLVRKFNDMITSPEVSPVITRRLRPNPFHKDDPDWLIRLYRRETTITPHIPYVELINWCDLMATPGTPEIEVSLQPGKFQLGDWGPRGNAIREAAFETFRAEKRTHNGPAVRIADANADGRKLRLTIQEADYFSQLRSNLVLDFQPRQPMEISLRALLDEERPGELPRLDDPRLANTLGIAALILVKTDTEFTPYLVPRSRDTAVFNVGGEWHCTASGVAKLLGGADGAPEFYRNAMLQELKEEVGLYEEDLDDLKPVAFCRELMRGGKPQMFFLGTTQLDKATLEDRIRNARRRAETEGMIVENTPMPFLRKPGGFDEGDTFELFRDRGFTAEAAACLYYFLKARQAVS